MEYTNGSITRNIQIEAHLLTAFKASKNFVVNNFSSQS